MSRFRQALEQALGAAMPGPEQWPEETVPGILRLLWKAYDRLVSAKLSEVDIADADLQLERSLNALLSDEIQAILLEEGGFSSYLVSHERWEMETLHPKSNRPSQYDIAFVWRDHPILKWPCEAKVLRTSADVGPYIDDIETAFIPCIYGPFTSSGAMLAFLVQGDPHFALKRIEALLLHPVEPYLESGGRPHGFSVLIRNVPEGKSYPEKFCIHHLIMHVAEK